MKLGNAVRAVRYQGIDNFVIAPRNGWGIFSQRSHIKASGVPKLAQSETEAVKVAEVMSRRLGGNFEAYKCLFCDGFHVGKNR